MKRCTKCKQEKSLDCFAKLSKSIDGVRSICKSCMSDYHKADWKESPERRTSVRANLKRQRQHNLEKMIESLGEQRCADCGETNLLKLEFDHLRDKKFNISEGIAKGYAWKRIKEEIDKCQVLCANCHAVKTAYQCNSWKLKFI